MAELLARHEVDAARLDHVIFGNCAQPAEAANITRVAALRAGVPERVPGVTVHRNCASGMEAVADAAYRIGLGEARTVLAGGMESMSQIPLLYPQSYSEWLEGVMRAKTPIQKAGAFARFKRALQPASRSRLAHTSRAASKMGQNAEVLARVPSVASADEFASGPPAPGRSARAAARGDRAPVRGAKYERCGRRRARATRRSTRREAERLRSQERYGHGRQRLPGHGRRVALLIGTRRPARCLAAVGASARRLRGALAEAHGLGPLFAMSEALKRRI